MRKKKVLYVSNIEVPYRAEFFNQLSKKLDLTVLYERKKSSNRDEKWANSVRSNYKIEYLKGLKIKNEYSIDLRILKYVFYKKYDKVIIGCYNSPSQILAMLIMRLFKRNYILNLDGEYFLDGNNFKQRLKRFLIRGAQDYLIAGKKSGANLSKFIPKEKVHPYYFSSLTDKELEKNAKNINQNINNKILVIGQYFDYKGLDIALRVAKNMPDKIFKFVGMGNRSDLFKKAVTEIGAKNVEVIPFLTKERLEYEYKSCKMLVLPSRNECWGLVINEAASYGMPIVASGGAGAAVEFLADKYSKFLAIPEDIQDLEDKIKLLDNYEKIKLYSIYLINKSKKYSVERCVNEHLKVINKEIKYEEN